MTKINPFVKWAGGKTQLLKYLRKRVPVKFGTYYEPFIGGGAFLFDIQPSIALINDINEQVINAYIQIRDNVEGVIDLITKYDNVNIDVAYYMYIRELYNRKIALHELDIDSAAQMIWLNKHCFNGLYRVNNKGLFNVPYNNKKKWRIC